MAFSYIDIFAGAGGLSEGFQTIVYTIALAVAPFGLALNSQFFRPIVNGLIAFSLRLFERLQCPSSR